MLNVSSLTEESRVLLSPSYPSFGLSRNARQKEETLLKLGGLNDEGRRTICRIMITY